MTRKTTMGRNIGKVREAREIPTRAGSLRRGESHPSHVLSEEDVLAIKEALRHPDVSKRGLARQYNVSPRTIQNIERGEAWAHLGAS